MPIPVKPCDGTFSCETASLLEVNADRAQWKAHRCAVCGQLTMPEQLGCRWVPERHWPTAPTLQRRRPWVLRAS
jgi:hypothetical protein